MTTVNASSASTPSLQPTAKNHVILFTRYPEPGKTKTRLIPALGADGAAALQKKMTEHTLATLRQFRDGDVARQEPVAIDVRFAGGDEQLMRQWLGSTWHYTPQGDGDLGDRLSRAFRNAFDHGAQAALAIGIDCPDITAELISEAFCNMSLVDVVLGPAADGGYYLIGLSVFRPELFQGIAWGTDKVFQQTASCADRLNLTITALQMLADVDRPSDLPIWERAIARSRPAISQDKTLQYETSSLSIIIPVLNESHQICSLLHRLVAATNAEINHADIEIIVADGGSHDRTVEVAQSFNVRVLSSDPGRATQMNAAARDARGDVLLFLHADTALPDGFHTVITETLSGSNVVAGAFELTIQSDFPALRLVEWGVKWRSRLFQMPYGDQALFIKRTTFEEMGGFADLPIMEDFELMQRLKQRGRVAIAPASVTTSGRRWETLGVLKTTLINQAMILGYLWGVEPARLERWYRGRKGKGARE